MKPTTELPTGSGYYWRRESLKGEVSSEELVYVTFYKPSGCGWRYALIRHHGDQQTKKLREPSSPDVRVEWYGPLISPWKEEE